MAAGSWLLCPGGGEADGQTGEDMSLGGETGRGGEEWERLTGWEDGGEEDWSDGGWTKMRFGEETRKSGKKWGREGGE